MNKSVAEVARIEGIGLQTLYNWRNKARDQGQPMPGSKNTPDKWSSEAKLATIIESSVIIDAGGTYQETGSKFITEMAADPSTDSSEANHDNTVIRT